MPRFRRGSSTAPLGSSSSTERRGIASTSARASTGAERLAKSSRTPSLPSLSSARSKERSGLRIATSPPASRKRSQSTTGSCSYPSTSPVKVTPGAKSKFSMMVSAAFQFSITVS